MSGRVYIYAEYQVSVPFTEIPWQDVNVEMKRFAGLRSKTWLSGLNNRTVGGFYEFDNLENAQAYVDGLLVPFAKKINGNLSVKLFDGEVVADASADMHSPFYIHK